MASREEKDRALYSQPERNLESPFLEEELFAKESEAEWEAHLAALEAESPFQHAFEQGRTSLIEPEEAEEEFVDEDVRPYLEPEEQEAVYSPEGFTDEEAESPFLQAFEQGRAVPIAPEEAEEESVDEDVRPYLEPEEQEAVYFPEGFTDEKEGQTLREESLIEPEELYPAAEAPFAIQEEEACEFEQEPLAEAEASPPGRVVFPSGESLLVVTGYPEGKEEEFWDPTESGNPLLDTGKLHKDKKLSENALLQRSDTLRRSYRWML